MALPGRKRRQGVSGYAWIVAYGNGKFVAISNNNFGVYSADGVNWTLAMLDHDYWQGIVYGE
jgi:hypothetical protein